MSSSLSRAHQEREEAVELGEAALHGGRRGRRPRACATRRSGRRPRCRCRSRSGCRAARACGAPGADWTASRCAPGRSPRPAVNGCACAGVTADSVAMRVCATTCVPVQLRRSRSARAISRRARRCPCTDRCDRPIDSTSDLGRSFARARLSPSSGSRRRRQHGVLAVSPRSACLPSNAARQLLRQTLSSRRRPRRQNRLTACASCRRRRRQRSPAPAESGPRLGHADQHRHHELAQTARAAPAS